jgi:hypothetical protein
MVSRWLGRLLQLAIVIVLVAIATTCGSQAEPDEADGAPVTTVPPEEITVVLAGDSVAENLAAPLRASLQGSAETHYVATLTIPRNAHRIFWDSVLLDYAPDVVVVLIGTWEIDRVLGETDYPQSYETGVVDPFIEQTTSTGADIVWIGMPSTRSARTPIMRNLDGVYREAVLRHGAGATYIDADDVLTDRAGRWTQTLPGPDGTPESLRGDDGAHLCPAGAVRVVGQVLDVLAQEWPITSPAGWETGPWRTAPSEPYPAICAET